MTHSKTNFAASEVSYKRRRMRVPVRTCGLIHKKLHGYNSTLGNEAISLFCRSSELFSFVSEILSMGSCTVRDSAHERASITFHRG